MRFSVICLTYKRSKLLEEAVYSVIQQTLKDWELLIINDYDLQKIRYDHPQIRIFNLEEKFKTLGDKRNFGVEQANGDYIIMLDDDDLFLPSYLENINKIVSLGDVDLLLPQKPIFYFNDHSKIHLSPHPICNTLVYRKDSIGSKYHYESVNFDELTPFYIKLKKQPIKELMGFLKPEQCGYVYRQDITSDKKYTMAAFGREQLSEQEQILASLGDQEGEITLNPHWNEDYVQIIKDNFKTPKSREQSQMEALIKKNKEELESAKNTWEKAMKFAEAANSRGLLATAVDFLGLSSEYGAKVSDKIYEKRRESCFGNKEKNIPQCERLNIVKDKGAFCSSCGCGTAKLARMDGEGYNKLHYPVVECPLKRPGFSNEENTDYLNVPISVIIPVLNDNEELNLTIKSIRETSPKNVEIIVIDDASDVPAVVDDKSVRLVRLEKRQGVGSTRHLGATMSTSDYLLFVDSHMRFDKNWHKNAMKSLISSPSNVVWCAMCLGLEEGCMDLEKSKGSYCGAKLVLYDQKENQVFEGKWIEEKPGEEYEISCLMGACYFFHKSWFFHIGGTKSLTMWGSDEPLLSAKTLLAGGSIRLSKSIKIGHKFRPRSPYSTGVSYIVYNKLRSMYMMFSNELYNELSSKIQNDSDKQKALELFEHNREEIEKEREYYKTIFIKDEKWLMEKIKL